jgi:hypothetical protein
VEEYIDREGNKRTRRIKQSDEFHCEYKREAMRIVKTELREKHGARWSAMPVADAVLDIWEMFKQGTCVGEHNVGMLYTQELDELLALHPRRLPFVLQSSDGTQKETHSLDFPSETINTAMDELKRRKLIDLSGCVLVPFVEHFCFPDNLHHEFAFLVGDQYGWPNGDAGDCFLWGLYTKLAEKKGWTCAEDVFGHANVPRMTEATLKRCRDVWIPHLDARLADKNFPGKGKVLEEMPFCSWVDWLEFIQRDIQKNNPG